jgi:hypothetical protein
LFFAGGGGAVGGGGGGPGGGVEVLEREVRHFCGLPGSSLVGIGFRMGRVDWRCCVEDAGWCTG